MLGLPGAMSGGGSRVSKGRMGSSIPSDISPAELKSMEAELVQLERKAPVSTRTQLQHGVVMLLICLAVNHSRSVRYTLRRPAV